MRARLQPHGIALDHGWSVDTAIVQRIVLLAVLLSTLVVGGSSLAPFNSGGANVRARGSLDHQRCTLVETTMTDKPESDREGTDEALMVRYQRGDRNALAMIIRRYGRLVYATAYGITGTTQLAAELTQDAFLTVIGQAGSFHIEMHFRSWLFGFLHQLVHNRCGNTAADENRQSQPVNPDVPTDESYGPHVPVRS